jgi:phage tail sheath protein FI
MAANFLHGVETIEINKGAVPVTVVKSAVIGLVGIAPTGDTNVLTLVKNSTDAAAFGDEVPGFNIPKALNAIFKQGAGTVLVVNVFDETLHTAAVTSESHVVTNGKTKTTYAPVGTTAPLVKNNAGSVTYVADTDYTIDTYGNIVCIPGGAITEGSTIKVTYNKLDAGEVDATTIIGDIDTDTDTKTGMQLLDDAFSNFGFKAKIIIAPGYSSLNSVSAEMIVKAVKYRGRAILDAPVGTTIADAITGRGINGSINFATSSKRAVLCFPYLKAYDAYSDADELRPYSAYFAGAWTATINEKGYWYSPSNREILGIVGVERTISWDVADAQTDANALNEVGITTIAAGFGTGIRTWGNRSAAFPTSTAPSNFMSVQMTADVIHESLELATLQFIDEPITQAWLDKVRETVNAFLRTLVGRGALVTGAVCTYDPALNPPEEIAAGHVTFSLAFMPPTPAERITYNSFIDINQLKSLA